MCYDYILDIEKSNLTDVLNIQLNIMPNLLLIVVPTSH